MTDLLIQLSSQVDNCKQDLRKDNIVCAHTFPNLYLFFACVFVFGIALKSLHDQHLRVSDWKFLLLHNAGQKRHTLG